MSEVQPESTSKTESISETPTHSSTSNGGFFSSWKFKLGLVFSGLLIVFIAVVNFYYPYWVSMQGLNRWSAESGAESIDCMMRDTDNNGYISCSAKIDQKVFPLECGASIFNIGCRVSKAELIRN